MLSERSAQKQLEEIRLPTGVELLLVLVQFIEPTFDLIQRILALIHEILIAKFDQHLGDTGDRPYNLDRIVVDGANVQPGHADPLSRLRIWLVQTIRSP